MTKAVDVLSSNGGIVVWLTSPPPGSACERALHELVRPGASEWPTSTSMVKRLPEARPGKVTVVDLADWIAKQTPEEDARLRPDGVHFARRPPARTDTSTEVAEKYLGGAVLDAWRAQWTANRKDDLSAGPPVPVLVLGDDTASKIGEGLAAWSDNGRRFNVTNGAVAGCGIGVGGSRSTATSASGYPTRATIR